MDLLEYQTGIEYHARSALSSEVLGAKQATEMWKH